MAIFINWSDELSVGIEEIDEQHKILVNLVNQMHDAIDKDHASETVPLILNELIEYTRIHFVVEESLMRILNYPGYSVHHDQHQGLIKNIIELQKKTTTGKTSTNFELMQFLKTWLTRHIMEEDMLYSGFFLAASVQPRLSSRSRKSWTRRVWGNMFR